ncbi:MAG: group III truncated hemoglobin [Bacteroidota bacterium]
MEKPDIAARADIEQMVDAFYAKVRIDPLLGGIFNGAVQDRWPEHLKKMYRFWETVLLGKHSYAGRPFRPHRDLPVGEAHFNRWKGLFIETVDHYFAGDKAEEAKRRAELMAGLFRSKIEFFRNQGSKAIQ